MQNKWLLNNLEQTQTLGPWEIIITLSPYSFPFPLNDWDRLSAFRNALIHLLAVIEGEGGGMGQDLCFQKCAHPLTGL